MDLKPLIDTRRKGEPDIFLFVLVFLLAGIGIAMTYSASAVYAMNQFNDSFYFMKKQLIWYGISFFAFLVFQEIDYRIYLKYTKVMLLVSFLLLALIFIPGLGHGVKGSVRWLKIGPMTLQPSEFVKVFMVIYLVKIFSAEAKGNQVMQLLIPMLITAVIFILIMLQPDFGTAMDLLFVFVFILIVSGFPLFYLFFLGVISIPMFYLLIYQVDYRKERLLAFLDPWKDRFGNGYHIIQSFIAFKKGGTLGVGLGQGSQKISRLPEPHTDFIFAVIAEEAGLIGTVAVVALYGFVFWRGVLIAMYAPDDFGRLLALGLVFLIVIQAFINIGVVTGSVPATGIPLPFVSYGGSSLLANMISAGIVLNISRYREVAVQGFKFDEEVWQ